MTTQETLAEAVSATAKLMTRFLDGFDDDSRTRQTEHLPNHAIWCLGHVSLYFNRVAGQLDEQSLPIADFVSGDGMSGDANRFDTEAVAFDSKPGADPAHYPTLDRGVQILTSACQRLADAVCGATDEELARKIAWSGSEIPLHLLVYRVLFHAGLHTGQITDLRRALGLDRVIR